MSASGWEPAKPPVRSSAVSVLSVGSGICSAAVDTLPLGLCCGIAIAGDGDLLVALKLLHRGAEYFLVGLLGIAGFVSQVVEARHLTRLLLDRIEVSDEQRNFQIRQDEFSGSG